MHYFKSEGCSFTIALGGVYQCRDNEISLHLLILHESGFFYRKLKVLFVSNSVIQLFTVATFWERAARSDDHMFSLYIDYL